ncbi:universal stress protein [Roseitranquillus sediminis]|uniref:universal stress protein n=1 Tax=Roseitranquillus sediminis TaxID=2809051 RepID=UPI001D0C17DC|nr:universal stress protein [Roseitranquillus sediminis]MBM9594091.1 universal stress protein [Roseitranquillus sediminis]
MAHLTVASDLSPRSERAMVRAISLAARMRARLTVVHVVDDAMPSDLAHRVAEDAEERLARFCAEQHGGEDASIDFEVRLGDPVEELLAEAEGADLLVAGTHRGRRFFDTVRETTVERLVMHSGTPVLIARSPAETDYATILAAIDGSPAASAALAVALKIAPNATVRSFYATQTGHPDEVERVIGAWSAVGGLPKGVKPPEVIEDSIARAMQKMVERVNPDLISLGAHSRGSVERWAIGSLTSALVREPSCDLLIARRAMA